MAAVDDDTRFDAVIIGAGFSGLYKKRMYMGYSGGIPEFRRRCDEVAAGGDTGFKLG